MTEIVAEISGNHGGSLEKAKLLILAAADAGCDYAKFQYYRPWDMPDLYEGKNEEMYCKLMVPNIWLPELFRFAKHNCIGLFASVFSAPAAYELLQFDVPFIKIASPESTRLPFETYEVIAAGVPPDVHLIISTVAADYAKMDRGLIKYVGAASLMYCPSGHPPKITREDICEFVSRQYW